MEDNTSEEECEYLETFDNRIQELINIQEMLSEYSSLSKEPSMIIELVNNIGEIRYDLSNSMFKLSKHMNSISKYVPQQHVRQHMSALNELQKSLVGRAEDSLDICNKSNYLKIDPTTIYHRIGHDLKQNMSVTHLWKFFTMKEQGKVQKALNELVKLIDYENSIINEAINISSTARNVGDTFENVRNISTDLKTLTEYDDESLNIVHSFLSLLAYIVKDDSFSMSSPIENEIQKRHIKFIFE